MACEECKKSKTKCEGGGHGKPCTRCQRVQKACNNSDGSSVSSFDSTVGRTPSSTFSTHIKESEQFERMGVGSLAPLKISDAEVLQSNKFNIPQRRLLIARDHNQEEIWYKAYRSDTALTASYYYGPTSGQKGAKDDIDSYVPNVDKLVNFVTGRRSKETTNARGARRSTNKALAWIWEACMRASGLGHEILNPRNEESPKRHRPRRDVNSGSDNEYTPARKKCRAPPDLDSIVVQTSPRKNLEMNPPPRSLKPPHMSKLPDKGRKSKSSRSSDISIDINSPETTDTFTRAPYLAPQLFPTPKYLEPDVGPPPRQIPNKPPKITSPNLSILSRKIPSVPTKNIPKQLDTPPSRQKDKAPSSHPSSRKQSTRPPIQIIIEKQPDFPRNHYQTYTEEPPFPSPTKSTTVAATAEPTTTTTTTATTALTVPTSPSTITKISFLGLQVPKPNPLSLDLKTIRQALERSEARFIKLATGILPSAHGLGDAGNNIKYLLLDIIMEARSQNDEGFAQRLEGEVTRRWEELELDGNNENGRNGMDGPNNNDGDEFEALYARDGTVDSLI
ncbi:MAG: hypothetical protein M1834_004872 [Cirrosporium novae-zelandiae]|nr:MAG: hypothetical protein M1834_004872 [Cirrosporium novae-zelandiae]